MKRNHKIVNFSVAIFFLLAILSQSFHQISHVTHHENEHEISHTQNKPHLESFEYCQLCDFIISPTPEIPHSTIEFSHNFELNLETEFYWINLLFQLDTQNQKQLRAPPTLIIA